METQVHEETYHEHKITIHYDHDPESPRQWDQFGTMTCFHRRHNLGDQHSFDDPFSFLADLCDWDNEREVSFEQLYAQAEKHAVILPLFLYDHSGIAMNTGGFSCPWDSGQVGFIHVTLEDIRKEHNVQRVSRKLREKVAEHLKNEVSTYDEYLTGNVYGFVVSKDDQEIGSCWGFLGDYEGYCLEEARACVPVS